MLVEIGRRASTLNVFSVTNEGINCGAWAPIREAGTLGTTGWPSAGAVGGLRGEAHGKEGRVEEHVEEARVEEAQEDEEGRTGSVREFERVFTWLEDEVSDHLDVIITAAPTTPQMLRTRYADCSSWCRPT